MTAQEPDIDTHSNSGIPTRSSTIIGNPLYRNASPEEEKENANYSTFKDQSGPLKLEEVQYASVITNPATYEANGTHAQSPANQNGYDKLGGKQTKESHYDRLKPMSVPAVTAGDGPATDENINKGQAVEVTGDKHYTVEGNIYALSTKPSTTLQHENEDEDEATECHNNVRFQTLTTLSIQQLFTKTCFC